tara:strand:- start:49401 stop:50012 length:612 start_codon:yes stop_codon:yes gene_type:complete
MKNLSTALEETLCNYLSFATFVLQLTTLLKKYNSSNFFKHTFCIFNRVDDQFFKENTIHFKSKSESRYSYTEEGIYRYSNHWGRVANCRWKLNSDEKLKNQLYYLGFAKWTDFYPMDENKKLFSISVDFVSKSVNFHHQQEKEDAFLFLLSDAQNRVKQIRQLFKEEKWARYFNTDIEKLRKSIVTELISSDKSLQEIKSKNQ